MESPQLGRSKGSAGPPPTGWEPVILSGCVFQGFLWDCLGKTPEKGAAVSLSQEAAAVKKGDGWSSV